MKKRKFSYGTTNTLAYDLLLLKHKRSVQEKRDVLLSEVEEELAVYCELKRKSIMDIKRGINQPSLPVAMRMASYFGKSVEELFTLKTKEDYMSEKAERIQSLLKELDSPVLDELNGLLEEFLNDFEDYRDETEEQAHRYDTLQQFYRTLPVGYSLQEMGQLVKAIQEEVGVSQKETNQS